MSLDKAVLFSFNIIDWADITGYSSNDIRKIHHTTGHKL